MLAAGCLEQCLSASLPSHWSVEEGSQLVWAILSQMSAILHLYHSLSLCTSEAEPRPSQILYVSQICNLFLENLTQN